MARGRAPCCDKAGLKKGPWSPAEDQRLISFIQQHGHDNWRALPKLAGLLRCGKSCRLRWVNYLRPDVKRGNLTKEEEETIIKSHESLGNKWSKIAAQLPGRTDNEIKNVWNTHLKKRLASKRSNDSGNETKESSTPSYSSSSSSYSSSADSSISCCKSTTQEKETQEPSDPKFNEGKQEHTTAMEEKTNSEDERMWLAYLESELGLHEQQSLAGNGVQQTEMMVSELEPTDIYFQMWPPSPPQF